MSLGRDQKTSTSPGNTILTAGERIILPDDNGIEYMNRVRAALSSYQETRRPPKQPVATATANPPAAGTTTTAVSVAPEPEAGSPVTSAPAKKDKVTVINPTRPLPSDIDPMLPKTFSYQLGLLSDTKNPEDIKSDTLYLGEKNGHVTYTVSEAIYDIEIPTLKAPKPFTLVELNKLKNQIVEAASEAKHIESSSAKNAKLPLFKVSNNVFGMFRDFLNEPSTPHTVQSFNRACRESNRLLQSQMRDEYQKKQPLLQKLLQYVVDADLDHAEEFIKWHYRFQLVTVEEKMPNPPEKDVINVAKVGNDLHYSLTTSDGTCSVKDRPITLAELNEAQKSIHANNADEKDKNAKKADQKIEIPANFSKEHLKALRPLILAITNRNKYTQPKNNRCLLTMKGMVGCDLYLMPDEKDEKQQKQKPMQNSDANCLRLYRKNNGLVYCINGKEYAFEDAVLNVEIAKLFDTPNNLNKNGILANNKLTWPQVEACKIILAETAKRGHSSYVYSGHRIKCTALGGAIGAEDEEMVAMLMDELRKLPDGETYIEHQIKAQRPEGWEAKEEKRHEEDVKALHKFRKAITDAKSPNDSALIAAIAEWKEYLEPKGITESGNHWNARLKYVALQIGLDKWYKDSWRNDLFYNVGIGSIDTHASTIYAMAEAQGLHYQQDEGEKFKRSLKYHHGNGASYYPLDRSPGSHLGADSWVDCYFGVRACEAGCCALAGVCTCARLWRSYVEQKQQPCKTHAVARQSVNEEPLVCNNVIRF